MSDTAAHDDVPQVTLGWRLRIALERADIKAEVMATELGVHRGTITRWTHEIGKPPRPVYLREWAAICGVPYAWLAGDAADTSDGSGRDTRHYETADAQLAAA